MSERIRIEAAFQPVGNEIKLTVPPERFKEMLYEAFADAARTTLQRVGELAVEIYGPDSEAAREIVPRLAEATLAELD